MQEKEREYERERVGRLRFSEWLIFLRTSSLLQSSKPETETLPESSETALFATVTPASAIYLTLSYRLRYIITCRKCHSQLFDRAPWKIYQAQLCIFSARKLTLYFYAMLFRKVVRASWSCGTAGALHIVTTNSVAACGFYILFPQIPAHGTRIPEVLYFWLGKSTQKYVKQEWYRDI